MQSALSSDIELRNLKQPVVPIPLIKKNNTLDESVIRSLLRDITQILIRIRYVVIPFGGDTKRLKTWDLWGPLALCITMSWVLSRGAPTLEANNIFGTVFCLIGLGSALVTLNAQIIGGDVSIFHCICTLGYSLFPLTVAAAICVFLKANIDFVLSMVIVSLGFLWSVQSASIYMLGIIGIDKRGLVMYPIFLFYIFIAFFIIQMTQ